MKRYDLIDSLRGLAIISMIGFHACWLLNYFGLAISNKTLFGSAFLVWERSICISFIMIAGFSFSLGHRHIRSGLLLSAIGIVITLVTCLFLPGMRIVFGILTFLGAMTLLIIPIDKISQRTVKKPVIAFALCILLFLFTYNINRGYIGLPFCTHITLPQTLYKGYVSTFIGFMEPGFDSVDYFSLIPWSFVYMSGYYLHKIIMNTRIENSLLSHGIPGVKVLGRHSLAIYIIHPIVLYALFYLISA